MSGLAGKWQGTWHCAYIWHNTDLSLPERCARLSGYMKGKIALRARADAKRKREPDENWIEQATDLEDDFLDLARDANATAEDLDDILDKLYDFADYYRIWIKPYRFESKLKETTANDGKI